MKGYDNKSNEIIQASAPPLPQEYQSTEAAPDDSASRLVGSRWNPLNMVFGLGRRQQNQEPVYTTAVAVTGLEPIQIQSSLMQHPAIRGLVNKYDSSSAAVETALQTLQQREPEKFERFARRVLGKKGGIDGSSATIAMLTEAGETGLIGKITEIANMNDRDFDNAKRTKQAEIAGSRKVAGGGFLGITANHAFPREENSTSKQPSYTKEQLANITKRKGYGGTVSIYVGAGTLTDYNLATLSTEAFLQRLPDYDRERVRELETAKEAKTGFFTNLIGSRGTQNISK